ncbi:MAG TPA: TonB family protein [Polyangia bacterium]|nr:TonB family protein [Polyangia bacterium]
MRLTTVVLSVGLHVGLAVGLVAVAQKRELRRRAISVAVQDEKKKAKPPTPPPPKPIVAHPKVAKVEPVAPKAAAAPVAHAAAAPVATNLSMSNAGLDVGPGIGLEGRAKPTAAPVKVASAISERRTQRAREEAGGASPDAPCQEEPTKPEAIVKTPLDYTLYPQAQADGVEGKFKARLTIDADGQVTNVEVTGSIDSAFDAAIVAALQRWRFKPAMACGKPVAGGTFVVARTFELGD